MNAKTVCALVWTVGLLFGCGPGGDGQPIDFRPDGGAPDVSSDADGGETDGGLPDAEPLPNKWCERLEPGLAETGETAEPLALSRIHSRVRFFGVEGYRETDRVLVDVLGENRAIDQLLADYASGLPTVCHAEPTDSKLPEAEVEKQDSVAILRPGRGSVSLDSLPETVVVDLRDLPAGVETWEALRRAVRPLLSDSVSRLSRRVRRHNGLIDEVLAPARGSSNFFERSVERISKPSISPEGSDRETRIVLRTGRTLSPEAAEFAAMLRVSGRAHLVGRSVPTRVAEAEWVGTQYGGVAFKARDLTTDEGERLIDTIPADSTLAATAEPSWEQWNAILDGLPSSVDTPEGARNRTRVTPIRPVNNEPDSDLKPGIVRANLIVVHAAARMFYAYFESEEQSLNERLETLWERYAPETSEGGDGQMSRTRVELAIRRLVDAFDEEHAQAVDRGIDETSRWHDIEGFLGIKWEVVGGKPVVRYTVYDRVQPGDRLVELDGTPVEQLIDRWRGLVSANNEDGEVIAAVNRAKRRMKGPYAAVFETPDGARKTVTLEPVGISKYRSLASADSMRDSGWLGGQETSIYYVNLHKDAWSNAASKLGEADGLVIDMRGYPSRRFRHRNVLASLTDETLDWMTYAAPMYRGPYDRIWNDGTRTIQGRAAADVADMPVAALVGIDTISAAENVVTPLWMHDIARFFGRPTAASNGNITSLWLPGKFFASFTGLKVELPDGRSFHNTGIQPDERVVPTASDLASGDDPVLNAATSWLRNQQN